MEFVPFLVDLLPFGHRAVFVAPTPVTARQPAMMSHLVTVRSHGSPILAKVAVVLPEIFPVFAPFLNVLVHVLTVPRGIAGGLRKTRRRDARRGQHGQQY